MSERVSTSSAVRADPGGRRERLVSRSIEVILSGQTPEGAYLAAPTFPTYRYCWFRDGSFIADAMDLAGRPGSAAAFHAWCVGVLESQLDERGNVVGGGELHTRYRADGRHGAEEWPNFQLDGFGTWLWAYRRHRERSTGGPASPLGERDADVVRRLAEYLAGRWSRPNFDCWEEHERFVHPSTLGAIYAGLRAAAELLGERYFAGTAYAVRSYLLTHGVAYGRFTKHVGSEEVDANLVWLALPYEVVAVDDPLMSATLDRLAAEIQAPDGGLHRYAGDTYYGGGCWPLLTADLAQVRLARGEVEEAERLLAWVEAQATPAGDLPEQVANHLNDPAYVDEWRRRWGDSACPLLWSHAAYLRLLHAMGELQPLLGARS